MPDGRLVPLFTDTSGETMTPTQQNAPDRDRLSEADVGTGARGGALSVIAQWLERIDPGTHRRIKGLRLVTAYGIAALLGALPAISHGLHGAWALSLLAGNFALWASVSEGRTIRRDSSRDLALLCGAAVLGAGVMIGLAPLLTGRGRPGPELTLVTGAFLVGYLKRYGVLGAGIGSQLYIGQLMAYMTRLTTADLATVGVAGLLAAVASIIPRLLSGPAEHPAVALTVTPTEDEMPALFMGLQAAIAAVVIVAMNDMIGLEESGWAITASNICGCKLDGWNDRAGYAAHCWNRGGCSTWPGVPSACDSWRLCCCGWQRRSRWSSMRWLCPSDMTLHALLTRLRSSLRWRLLGTTRGCFWRRGRGRRCLVVR